MLSGGDIGGPLVGQPGSEWVKHGQDRDVRRLYETGHGVRDPGACPPVMDWDDNRYRRHDFSPSFQHALA